LGIAHSREAVLSNSVARGFKKIAANRKFKRDQRHAVIGKSGARAYAANSVWIDGFAAQ